METPEHYVRREDPPPSPPQSWWRQLLRRFYHFMFEKEPAPIPPYHGNFQGATVNDPRYTPGLFNRERVDYSNDEADRSLRDDPSRS